ncbi:MAG: CvpA family protein [Fidelibacterota bacterium]
MNSVSIVDILIAGNLLIFTLSGLRNGFIKEVGKIAALAAGFILANQFSDFISATLFSWITDETIRNLSGYLAIFFISAIIVGIIARILDKIFEIMLLGWFNRLLGFLLGLVKGLLIIGLVIFILETIPASNKLHKRMVKETYLYATCNNVKNIVIGFSSYKNKINDLQESIQKKADDEHFENLKKFLNTE